VRSPETLLRDLQASQLPPFRPQITLAYAQSLDGSIATEHREAIALSSERSFRFTHQLRTVHDAILVGIGTVLADNPRLTVRLASGPDPQPIVLDTTLRFPPTAHLAQHPRQPWIATGPHPNTQRRRALEDLSVEILTQPLAIGTGISLPDLAATLHRRGIRRLMVEGGQGVLSAFLRAQLVDWLVITISPLLIGGLPALRDIGDGKPFPRLASLQHCQVGRDLLTWGQPVWEQA